jgi:GntR family transcriptional regulator
MAARYRVIADELRRRIMAGEYRSGEPLPRQSDLAEAYGTKRAVIAEAVRVLEGEGMVRAVRKRGTVVQWPTVRRRIECGNKITRDAGYTVAGVTVPGAPGYNFPAAQAEAWQAHGTPRASVELCPPRVAELLGVAEGDRVVRRRRVTSPARELPFQLVDSWIHPGGIADAPRAGEPDTGPGGYLDRLEEAGHGPISWTEHVRARMPLPDEADLLQIATRAVVIEIARVGTSAKMEAPVEVTLCVIPAERVEIITPLERDYTAHWPPPRQSTAQARNGE